MPKKFATENPKAVAARERKKTAKDTDLAKKQQAAEDAAWRDDDKQVLRKQQKREELERKKQEQLEKKAEAKALLEKEMGSIKVSKAPAPVSKVTRAQISQIKNNSTTKEKETKPKIETHLDIPLTENINRLTIEGDEARSVTEAIAILNSTTEDIDMHPEKRMKAAYAAFEERRLKELKEENPSLRLSQLKQMVFKEWQKSPENPLNCKE